MFKDYYIFDNFLKLLEEEMEPNDISKKFWIVHNDSVSLTLLTFQKLETIENLVKNYKSNMSINEKESENSKKNILNQLNIIKTILKRTNKANKTEKDENLNITVILKARHEKLDEHKHKIKTINDLFNHKYECLEYTNGLGVYVFPFTYEEFVDISNLDYIQQREIIMDVSKELNYDAFKRLLLDRSLFEFKTTQPLTLEQAILVIPHMGMYISKSK